MILWLIVMRIDGELLMMSSKINRLVNHGRGSSLFVTVKDGFCLGKLASSKSNIQIRVCNEIKCNEKEMTGSAMQCNAIQCNTMMYWNDVCMHTCIQVCI